jgi:hypothetical protein
VVRLSSTSNSPFSRTNPNSVLSENIIPEIVYPGADPNFLFSRAKFPVLSKKFPVLRGKKLRSWRDVLPNRWRQTQPLIGVRSLATFANCSYSANA